MHIVITWTVANKKLREEMIDAYVNQFEVIKDSDDEDVDQSTRYVKLEKDKNRLGFILGLESLVEELNEEYKLNVFFPKNGDIVWRKL